MLVSDLLDRTYSEWLYPAGIGRPTFDMLSSSISDATLTIPLDGRIDQVPEDTILQIDSELILTSSVAGTEVTAAERGYRETDKASHTAGTLVYLDPEYPRKVLFNALNVLLGDLFAQGIYLVDTTSSTYVTQGYITLPAGCSRVISVLINPYTSFTRYKRLVKGRHYEVYRDFDPPIMQMLGGGAVGRPLSIKYAKEISQASSEASDLTTLGVPAGLQPHLTLGVAGHLLTSRELPRVQVEEIRSLLAAQGIQVGAAMNVGQTLYNAYRSFVLAEAQKLRQSEEGLIEVVQ